QGRERPDGERPRVPERSEKARPCAELREAGLAPRQVIGLGPRGFHEQAARRRGAGRQRPAVVERLGGGPAGGIDAPEGRALAWLRGSKLGSPLLAAAGNGSAGPGGREYGPQGAIEGGDRGV